MNRTVLALDIGSNSVGSMWFDRATGKIATGVSVFPAGVDETDDKRGEPKNAKRRMVRRTRITLARRAQRKRELRLKLIEVGLLPADAAAFKRLLEESDPWELRRRGLDHALAPHEFGRVLLHLAQRRGALGLSISDPTETEEAALDAGATEDGKVKEAIGAVRAKMLERKVRTFGEFIAMVRAERVYTIENEDQRKQADRKGPRQWRSPVRNKSASYEHCADRPMIRHEFAELWNAQRVHGGPLATLLTDELRLALDDESGDSIWRHRGLLFGQRRQSWDLGTLGRCTLEPTERCVAHADMYASRFRVVETVNNLRIIPRNGPARPLTPVERTKVLDYLSGPLGTIPAKTLRGKEYPERPKTTVSVSDLRTLMGWGRASRTSEFRFNIESDEDREINTDWFSREVIHGAFGVAAWAAMPAPLKDGINRALLRFDPDQDEDAGKLRSGLRSWAGLNERHAEAVVAAWKRRPRPDAKRLNISRRAARNLLAVMDRPEPWPDNRSPSGYRWLTEIEARKLIAEDSDFCDSTTGQLLNDHARQRYATGAKGLSARDRHYLRKHPEDLPPAPMLTNPVVRKAIHEVRRHIIEHIRTFGGKPDEIYIELAREAKMGAKQSDRLLLQNRLRNRIRNDIIEHFTLSSRTSTQQRAAVDRVILRVQQGGVCPLCGQGGLTDKAAAEGEGCEVSHIIPRASGGHNGLGNIVLAHTKCNRDMGRRTPRQFWSDGAGFETGMRWVEGIYGDIKRPKFSEIKSASGPALWSCYFGNRDDANKIDQFKKDIKDIQEMTNRQDAATKYASRQVMAYLADALYEGKGLPERGGERKIFASDGIWTSRLRREWGLFFDPHDRRARGLSAEAEHERKEKDRGDHRHHAIDAVVIGLCTEEVRRAWDKRERDADLAGINTADDEQMAAYRRNHPIPPPSPFRSREEFRDAVKLAVYGDGEIGKPVAHRPVKRKLVGALHEETLFGPVLDRAGNLTDNFTAKKSIHALDPNHLRMPLPESPKQAIERLTLRRMAEKGVDARAARKWAKGVVESKAYAPMRVDPPPGKSGIVRDVALRARLRACLEEAGLNPDDFKANDIKKLADAGGFRQASGVPIRSFVLLRTMSDPVVIDRMVPEHGTGRMVRDEDPASKRAYVGGNNHHIEFRVDARGKWTGTIVSAFEAAQRKLCKLRALREAKVPRPTQFRQLPYAERRRLTPILRSIEQAHPIVDRSDRDEIGGRFVMSLAEGEMVWMRDKGAAPASEPGFFVVAKLDKPNRVVLVPHWDARAAGLRKNAEGKPVADSAREQFATTPDDLKALAPPGREHAIKVWVTPLGRVTELKGD